MGVSEEHQTSPGDTNHRVRRAFERVLRAGEVVYEPGDPGEAFYVVQSGEVELTHPDPVAAEGLAEASRVVARVGPGDSLGDTDALLGRPRSLRAVAITDAHLLQLDRSTFRQMCLERPEITVRILERMAGRISELERRLAALGMDDLVRPLVRSLLQEAVPAEEGARVCSTLRNLSDLAGLSLRDAHRALQELFERKLVRLVDDALLVPDPGALGAWLSDPAESTGTHDRRR